MRPHEHEGCVGRDGRGTGASLTSLVRGGLAGTFEEMEPSAFLVVVQLTETIDLASHASLIAICSGIILERLRHKPDSK